MVPLLQSPLLFIHFTKKVAKIQSKNATATTIPPQNMDTLGITGLKATTEFMCYICVANSPHHEQ